MLGLYNITNILRSSEWVIIPLLNSGFCHMFKIWNALSLFLRKGYFFRIIHVIKQKPECFQSKPDPSSEFGKEVFHYDYQECLTFPFVLAHANMQGSQKSAVLISTCPSLMVPKANILRARAVQ